jgi:hypothetical protein
MVAADTATTLCALTIGITTTTTNTSQSGTSDCRATFPLTKTTCLLAEITWFPPSVGGDSACGTSNLSNYFELSPASAGLYFFTITELRRGAFCVDRTLKDKKPVNLRVQAPIKYQLVIMLKSAKALGLNVAPTQLACADEVIE